MDSQKYLKQYAALEEAAKSEIIELLSNNPTGQSIGLLPIFAQRRALLKT